MAKKNEEPDFKKRKQKVGKKKVNPTETNVNIRMKRIKVQEQSIMRDTSDMVNYRNKSLADLVGQFTHYSAGVRKEAVLGLKDLFMQNEILYSTSLSVLITKTIPLLLDTDVGVRQALVNIYNALLINVQKELLLPFSSLISVYINNGLTSINPAIRRSSLLMVQTLLHIEPSLFKNSAVKILSSIVKLTTEVKASTVSNRGVLSSNKNQMKANSNEQRSVSELALETLQHFFTSCFSQNTIYDEINSWSGYSNTDDNSIVLETKRITVPLQLSYYSTTQFLNSSSSVISDPALISAMQALLGMLFASISELIPADTEQSLSLASHLRSIQNDDTIHSKTISEKQLHRLALLEELTANALIVLKHQNCTELTEKKNTDWIRLLHDFYPLRLTDSQRNKTEMKLLLQKVNSLTILLMILNNKEQKTLNVVLRDLKQKIVYISGNKTDKYDILPETVILKIETCHQLYTCINNQNDLIQIINSMWNELIVNHLANYSLPIIQFYYSLLNHHENVSYDGCLTSIIQCLKDISYERNTLIWKLGLRLLLGIIKSLPELNSSFSSEFVDWLKSIQTMSPYTTLPTELQSIILAILSLVLTEMDEAYKIIADLEKTV